ncbi:hypothetical protein ACLMJK_002242 [Lecanora helva]
MHLEYPKPHDDLVDELKDSAEFQPAHTGSGRRLAHRWGHRLSDESLAQTASPLKDSAKTVDPSTIPLGTGRSNSLFYPWQSMSMIGAKESHQSPALNPTIPMTCMKGESAFDFSYALNYAEPCGWSQLVAAFRENTSLIHNPPYQDWDTTLTCGSTSAIDISLRMFCNRGDWILTETCTYPGTLMALRAQGLKTQGIEMDEDGLLPRDLDAKLRCWDGSRGRKPHVLYTIPTGHNPTGVTQSKARKNAIYEIAERYDLLILEDDPYFFLRLDSSSARLDTHSTSSPFSQFRKVLPTSYLSLDKSGRVIRMESTSKILAPGLRCGWLTASSQVVDIFMNFAEVGPSSPSGPSQVMLYKLLVERWGREGFTDWLIYLSKEYQLRRDALIAACEKHLPKEICTWATPAYGIFLWIEVDLKRHPDFAETRAESCYTVEERIYEAAESNGVLVARGSWFYTEKRTDKVFFRMTFVATASQDDLKRGVEQFGKAVKEEFRSSQA